jgi:uncharacterized protein
VPDKLRQACSEAKMEHPKFVIKKSGRHFYFDLTAANGEIILNSELFTWRGSVEDAVASVKANAPFDERYDRRTSKQGRWYFVLKGAKGEVIGTSEMYASAAVMSDRMAAVQMSAPSAGVEVSARPSPPGSEPGLQTRAPRSRRG